MKRNTTVWLICAAALAAIAVSTAAAVSLRVGDPVPPLTLPELSGGLVKAMDGAEGSIVVVHFFATWCPPCREEIKVLNSISDTVKGKNVKPISVNVQEEQSVVAAFVKDMGASYTILLDKDGTAAKSYGVTGLPMTFIVDGAGKIRYKIIGEVNREGLKRLINTIQ